ncbi:MAG: cbb3-type cytochrome c oxidase subunit I [Elusimicrobia bacterium]|nr:cbb3-type cytochrome c oxidase subunit I [Elusimicrobiota bacterium]
MVKDPTKYFVLVAVAYLVLGGILGVLMMFSWMGGGWKGWDYYLIPTHTHVMLLGWVSMTMFGVAYRMFPAVLVRRLYSIRLAWVHFWVANVALVGLAFFFWLNRLQEGGWVVPLAVSGVLQFFGILIFAYNILRTALLPLPGEMG